VTRKNDSGRLPLYPEVEAELLKSFRDSRTNATGSKENR